MAVPLRVLCLDIEGGHGGSSRSLYFSLKNIDRTRIAPTVWCRRSGSIHERYAALGIPTQVESELPQISALARPSRNVWQLGQHFGQFRRASRGTLERLVEAARAHDLVHFNHEGFASLAYWLRRKSSTPSTMHIRTNLEPTVFARLQMRLISNAVDRVVFITRNEKATFQSLGGKSQGKIIHNIVEPTRDVEPCANVSGNGRFVVASLSNASWQRGTDRLLDVAMELKGRGRSDILFAIAGDMKLTGSWRGPLSRVAARGGSLEDAAREMGLREMFVFLGHVSEPERVLASADLLIKPTRDGNPWGRDIIEAMAAGVPVVSFGSDATFVESGVTGILRQDFRAGWVADDIIGLADHPVELQDMGQRAKDRVFRLCNGPDRARELVTFWQQTAETAK